MLFEWPAVEHRTSVTLEQTQLGAVRAIGHMGDRETGIEWNIQPLATGAKIPNR